MKKILKFGLLTLCAGMLFGAAESINNSMVRPQEVKTEASGLTYIDKALDQWKCKIYKVTDTRITVNLFIGTPVDFSPKADVSKTQVYYTVGGTPLISDIFADDSTETQANVLARATALNIFQGNIVIDGNPIVYNDSAASYRFTHRGSEHGSLQIGHNSDGLLKATFDITLPNWHVGMHTITIKQGTEIPSMAYLMNETHGSTTANSVYRITNEANYSFYSDTATVSPTGNELKVLTKSLSHHDYEEKDLVYLAKDGVAIGNCGNRVKFAFDTYSGYTRYATDGSYDPHRYYEKRGTEPQNHGFTDFATLPNYTGLKMWENVLINGGSAPRYYNDDRLRVMGNSVKEDGYKYGIIWLDIPWSKIQKDGGNSGTITIKFLKGMQIPTMETVWDSTVYSYLTLARDYEFQFNINSTATDASGTYSGSVSAYTAGADYDYSAISVPTVVETLKLNSYADGDSAGYFGLSEYDNNTISGVVYNCKMALWSEEFNALDHILINAGDGSTPTTPISSLGTAHGRRDRFTLDKKACGFIIGTTYNAPSFDKVIIKAGTRFPAANYICGLTNNANATPNGENRKFYVTESDVILVKVGDNLFKNADLIEKEAAQAILEKYNPVVSLAYTYSENAGVYTSEFRLMVGISSEFVTEVSDFGGTYGFFVECGSNSKHFQNGVDGITFSIDEDDGVVYFVIGLGDILNNPANAKAQFAVNMWIKKGEIVDVAGQFKVFSVASMIEDYKTNGDEATVTAVTPMYNIFDSLGIYDE